MKQYKNLLGVTLGTGFGAGVVINQKLLLGDNAAGGDIWCFRNKKYPEYIVEESVSIRAVMRVYAERSGDTGAHTPKEIFEIADRVTVLKDGQTVATVAPQDINMDSLIRMMVGRPLSALFPKRENCPIGDVVLNVDGLSRNGVVDNVSFAVRAGEVIGLGGLIGSGRTELVRLIFGADRSDSGRVEIDGKAVTPRNTVDGVRAGIGLVPEDRKSQGTVLSMPIRINSTMARLSDVTNLFGGLRLAHERRTVGQLMQNLRIKARDMDADVSTLSGGNQQKVVLAKWFHAKGKVIVLDEPTRGVDVGAKAEIYNLINALAAEGKAIVVVSSDHHELIGLCDRILVMGGGRLRGQLHPDEYSEERIVAMSLGLTLGAAAELPVTA